MKIIKNINKIRRVVKRFKSKNKKIGFVPTMGALHDGHLSLVKQAKKDCDVVILSIFVNPIQFGTKEDFSHYPRDFKRDEKLAKESGVDIILYPAVKSIYPEKHLTYVNVEDISTRLCGNFRAGHFKGVATIVNKLFNIVSPNIAYFGQKDFQQLIIIQRMVKDLNMDIKIKAMPIIRESDGLAMSSRNVYLSTSERRDAKILFSSLQAARRMIQLGIVDSRRIINKMCSLILSKETVNKIDYIEIVDLEQLLPVRKVNKRVLVALAVRFGKTRLIDNMVINGKNN